MIFRFSLLTLCTLLSSTLEQNFGSQFNPHRSAEHNLNLLRLEENKNKQKAKKEADRLEQESRRRASQSSAAYHAETYSHYHTAWEKELNYNEGIFNTLRKIISDFQQLFTLYEHSDPLAFESVKREFTYTFQKVIDDYKSYQEAITQDLERNVEIAQVILPAIKENLELLQNVIANHSAYDISKLSINRFTEYWLKGVWSNGTSFQLFQIPKFPTQPNSTSPSVPATAAWGRGPAAGSGTVASDGGADSPSSSSPGVDSSSADVIGSNVGNESTLTPNINAATLDQLPPRDLSRYRDKPIDSLLYNTPCFIVNDLLVEKVIGAINNYKASDKSESKQIALKREIENITRKFKLLYDHESVNAGDHLRVYVAPKIKDNWNLLSVLCENFSISDAMKLKEKDIRVTRDNGIVVLRDHSFLILEKTAIPQDALEEEN